MIKTTWEIRGESDPEIKAFNDKIEDLMQQYRQTTDVIVHVELLREIRLITIDRETHFKIK